MAPAPTVGESTRTVGRRGGHPLLGPRGFVAFVVSARASGGTWSGELMSTRLPDPSSSSRSPERAGRRVARVWIPIVLVALAIVVGVAVSLVLAAVFLAAAVMAVVADLWIRLGIDSQDDRDVEARARRYFVRRGRWPEDRP